MSNSDHVRRLAGIQQTLATGRRKPPAPNPRPTKTVSPPRTTRTPQRPDVPKAKPGLTLKQLFAGLKRNFPSRLDNAERDNVTVVKSGRRGHTIQCETLTYNGTKKVPEIRRHKQQVKRRILHAADPTATLPFSMAAVHVSCNCEDFLYTFEYALVQRDAAVVTYSNSEFPLVKNPDLLIGGCKHCAVVWQKILKSGV